MKETLMISKQKAAMNQLTKIISEIIALILQILMMILILMIYLKKIMEVVLLIWTHK